MKNNVVFCPPCGENVGLPTKRGAYKGFTLIELLVVVLIIGILAAVALPQYQVAVWKSRYATIKSLVHSMAQAEELYYLSNNSYTPDVSALDIELPEVTSVTLGEMSGTYYMPWGRCTLQKGSDTSNSYVECFYNNNGDSFLSYAIRLNHSLEEPGRKKCGAFQGKDLNSASQRVCRIETGKTEPDEEFNTGYGWVY